MVLEEAPRRGSDTFSDDSPPSDGDTYTTSFGDAQRITSEAANWPRRLTIAGWRSPETDKLLWRQIGARVQQMAAVLQRPPTADEADAVGYWTAKQLALTSYGVPLGLAGGAWRTYSTRASFRFPFYKPDLTAVQIKRFVGEILHDGTVILTANMITFILCMRCMVSRRGNSPHFLGSFRKRLEDGSRGNSMHFLRNLWKIFCTALQRDYEATRTALWAAN